MMEDSGQTVQMFTLVLVFNRYTCQKVHVLMLQLIHS